jgi:uncharacterized membrane protein YiaA
MKPSFAFVAISWVAALAGIISYGSLLVNSTTLTWSDKNFFFAILVFAVYAAISVQKIVRDRLEGVKFTNLYYGVSWLAVIIAVGMFVNGLFNVNLAVSERGFYGMAMLLTLFGAIAIQKNTRDLANPVNEAATPVA